MPLPELTILTAIHGRHDLAEAWAAHYAHMAAELRAEEVCELSRVAVLSPEDAPLGPVLDRYGVCWRTYENNPVAVKWQVGAMFARELCRATIGLMIFGSDDFASLAYVRAVAYQLIHARQGRIMGIRYALGPDRCYFLDAASGRLGRVGPRHETQIGAGRAFPIAELDALEWILWPSIADRALDTRCAEWLALRGVAILPIHLDRVPGAAIVDVKDGRNIHDWSALPYSAIWDRGPAREHLATFGLDHLVDLAEALR